MTDRILRLQKCPACLVLTHTTINGVLMCEHSRFIAAPEESAVVLSKHEWLLVRALWLRLGIYNSRQSLIEMVWPYVDNEPEYALTIVPKLIHKLRKKLARSSLKITSKQGWGYKLELTHPKTTTVAEASASATTL